jgi:hypothetical protein
MPCPVPDCDGGMRILTRTEEGTAYRIAGEKCSYCAGTGIVTPKRHAAYKHLMRGP